MADEDQQKKTERFGRYEIIDQLATGGMARIYKATTSGDRVFTIKKILQDFSQNEEFIRMFLEEAKISLQLKHRNIVRVLDFGQNEGNYYLAMEYVFGRDVGSLLKKSLEKKIHIPIEVACYIILQCCRGMAYAHKLTDGIDGGNLGIVHRDISPPNILISYNGEAKILDFGIAKAVRAAKDTNTRSGVLKGKFCYMSPEQARGEHLNHQSDLFSLGIVLHELLTSRSLFYSRDELETLERVRKAKIQAPSKIRKGIPKALDRIVMKALHPKAKRRYGDCDDLANELESFLQKNYPRTDQRTVAKFSRLLFREDFNVRFETAVKEGWKDIFISGGEDDEILLDRSTNSESSTTGIRSSTMGMRLSWYQRLIYDPKLSQQFFFWLKTSAVSVILLAGLAVLISTPFGQNKIQRAMTQAGLKKATPPPPSLQTASTEDLSAPTEKGSYAWWLQEARKAEKAGRYEDAVSFVDRALKINPFEKKVKVHKNFLLIQMGHSARACAWFEEQADIDRADRDLAQAVCLEASGRRQKAVLAYLEFLQRHDTDPRKEKVKALLESLRRN